ncbi:MAG: GHKL domain-containing protein [Mobilitalea sp.]
MAIKLVSSVLTALIDCILIYFHPSELIMYLILFVIHSVLTVLFFNIKRLKNGLPFLYKSSTRYIGIIISVFIFSFYDIASDSRYSLSIIGEAFIKLAVFSLLLFFWSKGNLSILYIERQKEKELEYAYSIIKEKDQLVHKLQIDNEKMSKIIHRDNKLIPSLVNAVQSFFNEDIKNSTDSKAKSQSLVIQLNELIKDRSGMIQDYKPSTKSLPKTKLVLIDMMAEYMLHKAESNSAEFCLEVYGEPSVLIPQYISEKNLCTIFADLIENALIAVKSTKSKKILIQIGLYDGVQTLSVSDNGISFDTNILTTLGKKQKTTHADIGGKGIGILSLFEINKKTRASFVVTEYAPGTNIHTKKVSVIFDSKNEYRISSYRNDMLKKNCDRADIVFY